MCETRVYSTCRDDQGMSAAVAALDAGQCVVFPTDTVYGVGCDLWRADAIEKLYWVKHRPRHLAIPVLVSSPEAVGQVARLDMLDVVQMGRFRTLLHRFWPGALTIIVPRLDTVPAELCAGQDTIAIRMPDHPMALGLIERMGGALAVTSANLSGQPSPMTGEQALHDLRGRVPVLLDDGECPGGTASSIVDLVSDPPRLLRAGGIALGELRECLPDLAA